MQSSLSDTSLFIGGGSLSFLLPGYYFPFEHTGGAELGFRVRSDAETINATVAGGEPSTLKISSEMHDSANLTLTAYDNCGHSLDALLTVQALDPVGYNGSYFPLEEGKTVVYAYRQVERSGMFSPYRKITTTGTAAWRIENIDIQIDRVSFQIFERLEAEREVIKTVFEPSGERHNTTVTKIDSTTVREGSMVSDGLTIIPYTSYCRGGGV